jgi:hypothetical protein
MDTFPARHPLHGASRRSLTRNSLLDVKVRRMERRDALDLKLVTRANNRARIATLKAAGLPLPGQKAAA